MEQALSKCCDAELEHSDEVCICLKCKLPCDWYIKCEKPNGPRKFGADYLSKYDKYADRRELK